MRVRALLLTAVLLVPGCGGGSGPSDPSTPSEILVAGLARRDRSPVQSLEGYLVFFYDRDAETLLSAAPVVNGRPVDQVFQPGIVPGPGYSEGINVEPGQLYQLVAEVTRPGHGPIEVTSAPVLIPTALEIEVPEEVQAGSSLIVSWSVTGAHMVNVAVEAMFSEHVPASQGTFTIPAAVFADRPAGQEVEVEITAYNTFYEPLGAAINALSDAEVAAERFRGVDNVEGGVGVFGGAFTLGDIVTVR